MRTLHSRIVRAACVTSVVLLASCRSTLSERAHEVAKDWSQVIRANQVIPVYPMTEDLEPGDVFLVDLPIEEQATRYEEDGYLPLDNHLVRLPAPDYAAFYRDGYWKGYAAPGPRDRPTPSSREDDDARRFAAAPAPFAAFPSYEFSVGRGGGLDLGLPISGVPVAVGLMGASEARASVTINDALTYGVATVEAWEKLRAWAEEPLVRAKLAHLWRQNARVDVEGPSLFLRTVTRVYLTGGVSVTVNRSDLSAAELAAGEERTVEVPGLPEKDQGTDEVWRKELKTLSTSLTDAMPGGALKLGYASRSSVSLQEEFERPLVIGYLGFDVPLYANGRLGAPVATRSVLLRDAEPPATMSTFTDDQRQLDLRVNELESLRRTDPDRAAEVCAAAAAALGPRSAVSMELLSTDPDPVAAFLDAVDGYVSKDGDSGLRYLEVVAALDAAVAEVE